MTVSTRTTARGERFPSTSGLSEERVATQAHWPSEDLCWGNDELDVDGPLLVEFDSRERFRCVGKPLDSMEELDRWGRYDGILRADVETVASGNQSARLETTNSGNRVWIYRQFDPGIDLSAYDPSIAIHPGEGETKTQMLRLQLLAPDHTNRIDMRHGVGKLDGWFRMDLGPTVIKGQPDLTDVREVRIQSLRKSQPRLSLNVDELRMTPKADRGRVMLTFDDGPLSQYTNAFPIMQEFGFPGVLGVIPWLASEPEFIRVEELTEMQDAGWDIVSHPQVTDPPRPLPELPKAEQQHALEKSKQWLLDSGFERGARFIIWPFSAAGPTTLKLASRYHYLGFTGGQCPSGIPVTDPLTIGRVDGEVPSLAKRMVNFAAQYNQLAVIMYHEVGPDKLSVSEFEATLRHINEANVDVITASGLWDLMT